MNKYLAPFAIACIIAMQAFPQPKQANSPQQLLTAIITNDTLLIKDLIKKGANVNAIDTNGATMLMWATYECDLNTVKLLIKKGANVKAKGIIYPDTTGSWYGNLLGIAAANNKLEMLKYFIEECNIPVDDPEVKEGQRGWTALQWAATRGDFNTTAYLLLKNANANVKDVTQSPLFLALRNYHSQVAQLLIMFGANWQIPEQDGWTPLHYIARNNDIQTFLSISNKLTPLLMNAQTEKGKTPLQLAVINNNYFMIAELCRRGASKEIKDNKGFQAIDYSIKRQGYRSYLFLQGSDYSKFPVNETYELQAKDINNQ